MKSTQKFFAAAAFALAVSAGAHGATPANIYRNLEGSNDLSFYAGSESIIQQDIATTYTGRWLSNGMTSYYDLFEPDFYTLKNPDDIGIIRVKGAGELEVQAWKAELTTTSSGNGGFYTGRVFYAGRKPTRINDPGTPGAASYSSFAGTLVLEDSISLRVSGYLNQYYRNDTIEMNSPGNFQLDYPSASPKRVGAVYGVQRVVLKDTARISFQNSPANIVTNGFDDVDTGPFAARLRFNIIQNVESPDSSRTEFHTGPDDTYRIVLHMDGRYVPVADPNEAGRYLPGAEGSFGYLRGDGQFIKTGDGNLRIKNDGDFIGSVALDGGVTFLASTGGAALLSAHTVNLVGNADPLGGVIPTALTGGISWKENDYRTFAIVSPAGMGWGVSDPTVLRLVRTPEYISQFGGGQLSQTHHISYASYYSILSLATDQTIRNFQTYFRRAEGVDEIFYYGNMGTGAETAVLLCSQDPNNPNGTIDRKLTVIQDLNTDGHYTGTIVGSTYSVFEKRGPGAIALVGGSTSPESFCGTFDVQEGKLIANGQSLGSGYVNVGAGGNLVILQNDSGTLLAQLRASQQGELLVTHHANLTNEAVSNIHIGDDYQVGVLQIYRSQPEFSGNLVVDGGVTLLLSARDGDTIAPNDAFVNANSVTLTQGTTHASDYSGEGRQTVLSFADSNQRVSNFSGDPKTRLELGRGTVTLRQRKDLFYPGSIRGAGNVVTMTDSTFTLSGENTYFGATVLMPITAPDSNNGDLRTARLVLGAKGGDDIKNTSAAILFAGSEIISAEVDADGQLVLDAATGLPRYQPQHFGMLFGEPELRDPVSGKILAAAPKIIMGTATLTIGVDASHLDALARELSNTNPDANSPVVRDIQAGYYFNTVLTGEKGPMPANPQASDFTVGSSRYYLETVIAQMTSEKQARLDPETGRPIVDPVTGAFIWDEKPGRGLSNADNLEYAGQIVGSGDIVKIGDQRLIFSAQSLDFTGGIDIRDGILRLNSDSFPNAAFITVGAALDDAGQNIVRYAEAEFFTPAPPADMPGLVQHVASVVSGAGKVSKVGPGAMSLDSYEYTGGTYVKNGTLFLPVLPVLGDVRLGGIELLTGEITRGIIGFDVKDGLDVTFKKSIYEYSPEEGATGDVRKIGAGRLVLEGLLEEDPGYALATRWAAGEAGVNPGQIAILEPSYRLSYSGKTFVDSGELVFSGKRWVWEKNETTGENLRPLVFANIPVSTSDYVVSRGATLTFDVDAMFNDVLAPAPAIGGALSGAGVVRKNGGGTLAIAAEQPDFTGDIFVNAGNLRFRVPFAVENSALLTIQDGASVFLENNDQIFQNLAGGAGAVLSLGSANLILNTKVAEPVAYSGNITGLSSSTLTKNGAGVLVLRGDNVGDFLGRIVITSGVLDTTTRALGDATSISADFNAILRLYSENQGDYLYAPVENAGVVEKTGPGTIHLAWDSAPRNATGREIHVAQGTLVLDSARTNNKVPVVVVDAGAVFQLNLQQDAFIHGGIEMQGTTYGGEITGGGAVTIDGQGRDRTFVMDKAPAYQGVTRIQNKAILDVSNISVLDGGIVSDATSRLHFGGIPRLFTIRQSDTGDAFEGTFTGMANLEITGSGILRYAGGSATGHAAGDLSSYAGSITVRGGNLEISVGNRKPIALADGNEGQAGSLYVRVPEADSGAAYSAPLSGSGNVVKVGLGDFHASGMNFLYDPAFITKTLAVAEGRIILDTVNLSRVEKLEVRDGCSVVWAPDEAAVGGSLVPSIGEGTLAGGPGGTFEKIDSGALLLRDQPDFKGEFRVLDGELRGNFKLGGSLLVSGSTASLSPGESPGVVQVEGAFVLEKDATLKIEIQGSLNDKVIYGTTALLDGILEVSLLGGTEPVRGTRFKFIEKAGENGATPGLSLGDNLALRVGTFDGYDASNLYFTLSTDPDTGAPVVLVSQKHLARVAGYTPHEGLRGSFLPVLDGFSTTHITPGSLRKPVLEGDSREQREEYKRRLTAWEKASAVAAIGGALNNAKAGELPVIVNNLSPLGYGSLVSMQASAHASANAQLLSRLEQRRYDVGLFLVEHEVQFYAIATGTHADLGGTQTSGANYNHNTAGAVIGADYQFASRTTVGIAADYANGKASFRDGGGDARMDAARATAYASTILGNDGWFLADAGLSAGYEGFDVRRHTVTGTNKASPEAWSVGAFVNFGTAFVLHKDADNANRFDLTPAIGLEYNHYDISSAHETGSLSNLNVTGFKQDSLRLKIGTGLNWFIFNTAYAAESSWKVGLDVRFTSEILGTETKLTSSFATAGGGRSRTTLDTLPAQTAQISPSLTWNIDARSSVFGSYQFEYGFEGQQYHSLSLGFRHRF
ncbi:MAG: autotransporter domain-containing protein [Puniceicoccales bacterium]|jgi:uncharacterized protein with beta-barrel porin domain|nr:autotransporter domain-containing protein [Puniceicoccales bacterium]